MSDRFHRSRPVTADDPLRADEIELTQKDVERLERMSPEEALEEKQRLLKNRVRAVAESVHDPLEDEKAELVYQALFKALFPPDPPAPKSKAKAKKRNRDKAAKKSRQRNRR